MTRMQTSHKYPWPGTLALVFTLLLWPVLVGLAQAHGWPGAGAGHHPSLSERAGAEGSDHRYLAPHVRRALPPRDGDDAFDGADAQPDHLVRAGLVLHALPSSYSGGSSPSLHFARSPRHRLAESRAPPF